VRHRAAPSFWQEYNALDADLRKLADKSFEILWIPFKMRENIRQDRRMSRDEVINKLRAHEPELKAAGIVRLAVFGSVARGDNSPESDVDLLADFDKTKHYTLLTMGRLENRLADLLGTRVDLSSPEWLKESVKNRVLEEAVLAF
jgi:uncharacterized protein